MAEGKRPKIDWEKIEVDYRAGLLSVHEVARQHKISHTLINRKAKAKEWKRDLAARVRKAVSARLVSGDVPKSVAGPTDEQVVETAAAKTVEVIKLHQATAARAQRVVSSLFEELCSPSMASLKDKATTANNLSNALRTLVTVERQAHGLDGAAGGQPDEPATKGDVAGMIRRLDGDQREQLRSIARALVERPAPDAD